ncbi:hypothetical protein LSAT2_005353, partial [Lamellibrachia satsuma]
MEIGEASLEIELNTGATYNQLCQRWALLVQGYDYELIYRPGANIANADALSRLPLPETVEVPVPEPVLNLLQHLEEG